MGVLLGNQTPGEQTSTLDNSIRYQTLNTKNCLTMNSLKIMCFILVVASIECYNTNRRNRNDYGWNARRGSGGSGYNPGRNGGNSGYSNGRPGSSNGNNGFNSGSNNHGRPGSNNGYNNGNSGYNNGRPSSNNNE